MLRAVSSDTDPEPAAEAPKLERPAWWVRVVSRIPLVLLNRLADLLGWLAFRTQSLVAPVVLHGLFNLVSYVMLVILSQQG